MGVTKTKGALFMSFFVHSGTTKSKSHETINLLVFRRKLFQRLALCLRDKKCREDTGQHEERQDLETRGGSWSVK